MKKTTLLSLLCLASIFLCWYFYPFNYHKTIKGQKIEDEENIAEKQDGIFEAQQLEFELTKDVTLGYVPKDRLINAYYADLEAQRNPQNRPMQVSALSWTERGPDRDTVGPSNGNKRANNGVASGRIRAIWVDLADATNKTVWVGGIDGGLWRTFNITDSLPVWTLMNDFFPSMAISSICQDPSNINIMYFGTGEKTTNEDAVYGGGVWKSTDHGVTWNALMNGFYGFPIFFRMNVSKVLCDASGNVYVAFMGPGFANFPGGPFVFSQLLRTTDGGTTFKDITPTAPGGFSSSVTEMKLSSTGRLHIVCGYYNGIFGDRPSGYRYTDNPATVTPDGWTAPATSFSSTAYNVELAVAGNTLYALPSDASYQTPVVWKSMNGGANWAPTSTSPPVTGVYRLSDGQAWYCIALAVDPANPNKVIAGGYNTYRSGDGGVTWQLVSTWFGPALSYIHADQQTAVWNGNQVLVGCDGGIFYSDDGGATFRDRNIGLRIKQFYSCAIHPFATNYFLGGTQDNGSHKFTRAGLSGTTEVTGGDGGFAHIDQNQPQYQFAAYTNSQYYRSTDNGATWSFVYYAKDTGQFINPTDYDDAQKRMYASGVAGEYVRWDDPATQTGHTFTPVPVAAFNGEIVRSVTVSPYTSNRVFFGTSNGRVIRVDHADGPAPTGEVISLGLSLFTDGFGGGTISCIAVGTNDKNLIVTLSNYGASHIWVTTTGGDTTGVGYYGAWKYSNLGDIPVRWAMFYPNDDTKAIVATELGVYETSKIDDNGLTIWTRNPTFPMVRTDMLQYRPGDRTIAAATHGRGLWTATISSGGPLPVTLISFDGMLDNKKILLNWHTSSEHGSKYFDVQKSSDGVNFVSIGQVNAAGNSSVTANYHFTDGQVNELNYYRLRMVDIDGKATISSAILIKNPNAIQQLWVNNPFHSTINIHLARLPQRNVKVELINMGGSVVYNKTFGTSRDIFVDFSGVGLSSGNYVLRTIVDGKAYLNKLLKQ